MSRIERIERDKKRFLDLLLDADPYEPMLDRYLETGEMFVMFEGETAVCEAVIHHRAEDGEIELKNLATAPAYRRKGYARQMIDALARRCSEQYRYLYVGTSNPAVYQAMGFEYAYTEPDFFTKHYPEPIVDEGVLCVDMIYLRRALNGTKEER
jgi:ribosomal protein S18 acetylase RimI-like enzyme